MKKNTQSQTFPITIMTNEKWWKNSEANKAFSNGEPVRIFAAPSCHGGGIDTSGTEEGGGTTEGDNK